MHNLKLQKHRGFTLIELLLSIALLTIIAGIAAPVAMRFYTKNNLDVATHSLVQTIRKSQILATGAMNDSSWGVNIDHQTITIFEGNSFAERNQEKDETYYLPGSIDTAGVNEVVFEKMSGAPKTTGGVILSNTDNENQTISINSEGILFY